MRTDMSENEENSYFEVNGCKVWFEKFGSGSKPILLIPGPIGTGRTDFEELVDGEDELDFDEFTAIAVEAPGWGRSRPPVRQYGVNVYNNDSQCFHKLMNHLGYDKYSIIGFSEGARVALLMAINYPDSVTSLVLSALKTYASNKGLSSLLSDKSVDKWNKSKIEAFLKVYEKKDEIQKLWTRYLNFAEFYNQYFPEDMFKNKYHLVRCPVLVTHGDKDSLIEVEQPLKLCKSLRNARLHRFSLGEHYAHQKYAIQYNRLVQDHILNPPSCPEEEKSIHNKLIHS